MPENIGAYQVTSLLGEGGMGAVFRARDTRLKRDVAIKVLLPEVANDPERLARFQREAEVLATLNHPNIAHIYGLEEGRASLEGREGLVGPFLVLELVEGPTLADRIAATNGRGLPLDEALPIAKQIADALEAAHEHGIIHRDLKPANIKVREDGTVKVLDFGLAKASETTRAGQAGELRASDRPGLPGSPGLHALTQSPTLTSPALMTGVGMLLGTAAYMSPEQAKGKPADRRADIWAFGCVLYEMLIGQRAFPGEDVTDTIVSVLSKEPDWTLLPESTPRALRTLLQRCLAKERKRRLDSATTIRLEIDDLLVAGPEGNHRSDTPQSSLRPAPLALAFVAGAALALLGGAWAVRRLTPPPSESQAIRLDIGVPPGLTFGSAPQSPTPALTPDGRCIFFTAARIDGGSDGLFKRCLDDQESRLVPGSSISSGRQAAGFPFVSSDGNWIAFYLSGRLVKTLVTGGPIEVLKDGFDVEGSKGTWNAAGDILVPGGAAQGLIRLSASGGPSSSVTTPDASAHERAHTVPSFLPDGRHFLYVAIPDGTLKLGSLDGGDTRSLGIKGVASPMYVPQGYLLYVAQQNLIARPFDPSRLEFTGEPVLLASSVRADAVRGRAALSASAQGTLVYRLDRGRTLTVEWVDRTGDSLSRPVPEGNYRGAEPSPDGSRVALRRRDELAGGSLWLLDSTRGTDVRIQDGPSALSPRWSPDGRALVFNPGGDHQGLYVWNAESPRGADPVFTSAVAVAPTDWSADGRYVLYEGYGQSTGTDMWALPMTGATHEPMSVLRTPANEGQAVLSADGKWIAYTSDESGRLEVYIQAFPVAGERWQVSTRGGRQPRWRRDGHELFFLDLSSVVMSVDVQPQATRVELRTPRRLFQIRPSQNPDLNPAVEGTAYAVSADGQRFLVTSPSLSSDSEPLTVVLNWPALLRPQSTSK